MRSSWFTRTATRERGFTLLEVLLVASIAMAVTGGLYTALEQGWRLETRTSGVERAQSAAAAVLREIVEGAPEGPVPGLISARWVECDENAIGYVAGYHKVGYYKVSYYLLQGTIYRYSVHEPDDGNLEIVTSGGVPVAEGITTFEVEDDGMLVYLTVGAAAKGGTKELVRLATKVRPRNRSPVP